MEPPALGSCLLPPPPSPGTPHALFIVCGETSGWGVAITVPLCDIIIGCCRGTQKPFGAGEKTRPIYAVTVDSVGMGARATNICILRVTIMAVLLFLKLLKLCPVHREFLCVQVD